jgi:SAM-dependent methyltransferase
VEDLPYPDNTFDLVTSFDVLVCAEVGDDLQAMREFARVTRPGGHVLLRLAAMKSLRGPHDTVVHGIRRYSSDELSEKLCSVGLEAVTITYANSLLLPLIYPVRKWQNLIVARGREPASDLSETAIPINAVLNGILHLEAAWIRLGGRFPMGVSVMALARKILD